MMDETLHMMRGVMIDQALKSRDRDAFQNLTGPDWKHFLIAPDEENASDKGPLEFLIQDTHFWEIRLIERWVSHPYVNYRYRDHIDGFLYIGEIRIPVGWNGEIESSFRPRPCTGPYHEPPQWFQGLINTVKCRLGGF